LGDLGEKIFLTQSRKGRQDEPYSLPNLQGTERKARMNHPYAHFAYCREAEGKGKEERGRPCDGLEAELL
jgi:hypothetical protein